MPFLTIIFFPFLFLMTTLPTAAADNEQLDDPKLPGKKQDVLFVGEMPKNADTNSIEIPSDVQTTKETKACAKEKEKYCRACLRLNNAERGLYEKTMRDFVTFDLQNHLPSEKKLFLDIRRFKWLLTINFVRKTASLQEHTSSCIADKMSLNVKTLNTYIKHTNDGFIFTPKGKELIERSRVAPLPTYATLSDPTFASAPPPTAPLIPQYAIAPCLRTVPLVSHAELLMPFFAMMQRQLLIRASFSTAIPISPYPNPLMPYSVMPGSQPALILPIPPLAPLAVQPNSLKRKSTDLSNAPDNLQSSLNISPTKFRKLEEQTGRI